MTVLLDTHAFIWAINAPDRLTATVRDLLLDEKTERWVSTISLWEIAIKVQAGKLQLRASAAHFHEELQFLQASPLPLEVHHTLELFQLPMYHRDPFDRMLIAQARAEGYTIVTCDDAFRSYDVATLW